MSSRQPSSSRKRKQSSDDLAGDEVTADTSNDDLSVNYTVFGGWLDDGLEGPNGLIEHEGFSLTIGGQSIEVSIGDAVLMRSEEKETSAYKEVKKSDNRKVGTNHMIARVDRIWENPGSGACPYMFQARWFLRKEDLESLQGEFALPNWDLDFVSRVTEDDLILSNKADNNPITTIVGYAHVVYRRPESDGCLPTLPAEVYVCRYSLSFGDETELDKEGIIRIVPFVGKDDNWEDFGTSTAAKAIKLPRSQDEGSQLKKANLPGEAPGIPSKKHKRYYSDSDSSLSDEFPVEKPVISEGTIDHRNTRVGPEHQVEVPPFTPNQKVVSRNPKPVWKPGQISREDRRAYMKKASNILVPYLFRKGLTHTDPYSPLPWKQMESLAKEIGSDKMLTLSTICTASELSERRTDMLREVDADALMRLLHEHSYNIEEALQAVESSPKKFVSTMNISQKEIVNSAFRRYAGSFRMVYKALAPAKSFQDVIDYIYRYKIPDQFRLFQQTKREQAIRMLECIESRRNPNSAIPVELDEGGIPAAATALDEKQKNQEWQKTSISEGSTKNLDDRRVKAKQLLLDVEEQLGEDKMREIVILIKTHGQRPAIESRTRLLGILHGNDALMMRMLEFLPKRF